MTYQIPIIDIDYIEFEARPVHDGWQHCYYFANGYEASVVHHAYSYGLELAVLYKGKLCYDTAVTSDVVGHIANADELQGLLEKIRDLPARE